MIHLNFTLLAALAVGMVVSPALRAERADRDKPVSLEADKVSVDDANKVLVFDGNVLLSQGTMTIRATKLVVKQDANGFQSGSATGGNGNLARFKQKREGRDDHIEGEADRIEHDARTEKTEFFGRARVRTGGDVVTGNYISFDGVTERYLVTGGLPSASKNDPRSPMPAGDGRVRATIQPKGKSLPENAQ